MNHAGQVLLACLILRRTWLATINKSNCILVCLLFVYDNTFGSNSVASVMVYHVLRLQANSQGDQTSSLSSPNEGEFITSAHGTMR